MKRSPRCLVLLVATVLSLALRCPGTVVERPINGGFEGGFELPGWTVTTTGYLSTDPYTGNTAVNSTDSVIDISPYGPWNSNAVTTAFLPVEGDSFAVMRTAGNSYPYWPDDSVTLSQTFFMWAGEYLSGYAAALVPGSPNFGFEFALRAEVNIRWAGGQQVLWSTNLLTTVPKEPEWPYDDDLANILAASTPWTKWSFIPPENGLYTLNLTMKPGFGESIAMFDAIHAPDSGSTFVLFGLACVFLTSAARRRLA